MSLAVWPGLVWDYSFMLTAVTRVSTNTVSHCQGRGDDNLETLARTIIVVCCGVHIPSRRYSYPWPRVTWGFNLSGNRSSLVGGIGHWYGRIRVMLNNVRIWLIIEQIRLCWVNTEHSFFCQNAYFSYECLVKYSRPALVLVCMCPPSPAH